MRSCGAELKLSERASAAARLGRLSPQLGFQAWQPVWERHWRARANRRPALVLKERAPNKQIKMLEPSLRASGALHRIDVRLQTRPEN